jgi:hypothetical protein
MITEFKQYSDLPFSKKIQEELLKRHTHAELVSNPEAIVYAEKDVLILMQMLEIELRSAFAGN